jgi:KDO2-lipid IV(A) lauroyltransferase
MGKETGDRDRKPRRRPKKGRALQLAEYAVVLPFIWVVRALPVKVLSLLSCGLGRLLFLGLPERRNIALENLRHALGTEKSEDELQKIARRSCASFLLTLFETIKFHDFFKAEDARDALRGLSNELEALFQKAKRIHDEANGCIFVTPHIGNWEYLPHVSSVVGIPLVVVARPLGNAYLERLIYSRRTDTGQVIVPKKNALFALQRTLQEGKSIGMLPDQSTRQGVSVDFFGRKASTSPVPAMLSILYKRPIVVVACCRKANGREFEGVVSDPLWPEAFESEKEEILRLTEAMNRQMETIIRKYPDQYFWIHNRWKTYRSHREFLS